MFLDFYGLAEQPFGATPDPRYLYLGASHREALASLFYGIKMGRGILSLVAQPGMGKTSLLFRFLEHLRRSARTAFLFQTQCDSTGLLQYLLTDLGIDVRGQNFVAMHEQLNELLLREARAGRRIVLVIDEAQNLDNHVLETARLLSDFETPREKLLQIVLGGQPQLAEKLQQPELAQLRQRIDVVGRLEPFNELEVVHYIEHRLRVAGYKGGRLFRPAAADRIAECSGGIPRNINSLCFNALSLGCAYQRKQIDAELVLEAISDLDFSPLADQRRREPLPVVRFAPAKPAGTAPVSRPGIPVFRTSEPKRLFGRAALVTPILAAALLASVYYRGSLKATADSTRRTLAAVIASLASHPIALPTDVQGSAAPRSSDVPAGTAALPDTDGTDPLPAPELPSPKPVPSPAVPLPSSSDEQSNMPDRAGPESGASPKAEFAGRTATVIVQPHDSLRKICLQYMGSYTPELQREISILNPALTDPDHIEPGQRILLPRTADGKFPATQNSPRDGL